MKSFLSIIIMLCGFMLLASENIDIEISNNPYFSKKILMQEISGKKIAGHRDLVDNILSFYVDKSFPFAVVKIDSIKTDDDMTTYFLNIDAKDYVKIRNITFSGNELTKDRPLRLISGLTAGQRFDEGRLLNAKSRLYRTGLFKKIPETKLYRDGKGHSINFLLSEKKYNEILLLGGYSSLNAEKVFSGLVRIETDNLFGTMRKAFLRWNRSGDVSEKFEFYYKEPFFFKYLISSEFEFVQNYFERLYLSRSVKFSQNFELDPKSFITYGYSKKIFYPDSLYSKMSREITERRYFGGMEFSTLVNNRYIPQDKGFLLDIEFSSLNIAFQDSSKIDGINIKAKAELISLFGKSLILNPSILYEQILIKQKLPEFSRMYFGGADSFRGYREDLFRTDLLLIQSVDIFFLTDQEGTAFNLFTDICQYNAKNSNADKLKDLSGLRSYGGGITFEKDNGSIQITVAVPEKEGFGSAVMHAKYSVKF
ncbi:MAG: POTRA domain-containing protein [Candidatus Delongbacteria bacterium]